MTAVDGATPTDPRTACRLIRERDFVTRREALRFKNVRTIQEDGWIVQLSERCTGMSSDALVAYALGTGDRPCTPGRSTSPRGGVWHGDECGRDFPHDMSDLDACERTYIMAPPHLRERMLPVLMEFRAWVLEGRNRYGDVYPEFARAARPADPAKET